MFIGKAKNGIHERWCGNSSSHLNTAKKYLETLNNRILGIQNENKNKNEKKHKKPSLMDTMLTFEPLNNFVIILIDYVSEKDLRKFEEKLKNENEEILSFENFEDENFEDDVKDNLLELFEIRLKKIFFLIFKNNLLKIILFF